MSWQPYVDVSIVGSGNFDQGAIFALDGSSCWAASEGFQVEKKEVDEIVKAYNETGEEKSISMNGLYVAGVKYVVLKAEGRSIYARKEKVGVVIVKTTKAILIGHYPEHIVGGTAVTTMEQLADYLITLNS